MVTCHQLLVKSELAIFESMAMRNHFALAMAHIGDQRLISIGAFVQKRPVGLLLGFTESKHIASIRSVYVLPEMRRKRIASRMIENAEHLVEANGIEAISLSVFIPSESLPIRGVIKTRNWKPEPRRLRILESLCSSDMGLRDAPWRKKRLVNRDIEVFPWHEVRQEELDILARDSQSENCWYDRKLSPLIDNTYLYAPLSIGLRYKGEIIGWSIAHRLNNDPINFSVMFSRRISEYPFAGFHLLQSTADKLVDLAASGPPTYLHCAIMDGNKFFEFMERKVFDYLPTEVRELDVYCKEFCEQKPITTMSPQH